MTALARRLLTATLLAFVATLAVAQAVDPPPLPDVKRSLADVITAVGTIAIPWLIAGAARLVPRTPRALLPLLPLLLGWGVDALTELATGVGSPVGAAGIAVGAMALREVLSSLSQHGLAGGGGAVLMPRQRMTEEDLRLARRLPPKHPGSY